MDFTVITELRVGGQLIPWDLDVCRRPDYIQEMLGWIPNFVTGGEVRVCDIIEELDE